MARDPSGDESVTPTSSSLAQGRGPPAGAHRVDSPGQVLSPPAPPPPPGGANDSAACVGRGTPDPWSQVCPADESHSPAPHPVCLTPAASDGGVASSLEESPVPLAQKPKEPPAVDCSPSSTGTVATVKACSQSSADSGYTPVEHPSSLATVRACSQSSAESATTPVAHPSSVGQSPRSKKRPGVLPPSNGAAVKRGKKEQGTKTALIDPDAMALDNVDRKPSKAEVGRVLPTARSLKLRILPDQYVAGACFYYAVAQSLHAITSNTPLDGASLRARAIAVFRDMCGLSIQESTLSVNRDLEKDTWGGRPQGGMPDHFAALAKHVDRSVVLLRSDRYSIVTSGFGIDSALTSATVWVPGREHPLHYRDCGDMEEQCHRATVVVIAEAERDGVKGGGHFRGAVFDHSLQVAPFCTLHGMMGILAYKRGPVGGVRAWHLQLGVGGMKGHTNATDCRRTRLVQRTRNYKPLVTLVNKMAREMLPDWFTSTTMQLSCNVLTKPHQHVHDASPWSAVFSTGQHTRGHIWVEVGGVCNGRGGRRCSMECLDGVTRVGATYDVCQ